MSIKNNSLIFRMVCFLRYGSPLLISRWDYMDP